MHRPFLKSTGVLSESRTGTHAAISGLGRRIWKMAISALGNIGIFDVFHTGSGTPCIPELPEFWNELLLYFLQEVLHSVPFLDRGHPSVPLPIPVAVRDLQRLILHQLQSKHRRLNGPQPTRNSF